MKKLNENEAKSLIKNSKGYRAIFWYSDDCPVCTQFLKEELPKVQSAMTQWMFYKINFDNHVKENGVYFEPARMPMGYFFKDDSRLFVGDGFAPAAEVIAMMTELESASFKTDKQKEEDQLNLL